MALKFSAHLTPGLTLCDCMGELSAFKFAANELRGLEEGLLGRADLVFTSGRTLYEAKRRLHPNTHLFPSSIDKEHFAQARTKGGEPADQARIPGPKIGFYGVIGERFYTGLIRDIASARPGWNIILIGPVVKLDPVPTTSTTWGRGLTGASPLPVGLGRGTRWHSCPTSPRTTSAQPKPPNTWPGQACRQALRRARPGGGGPGFGGVHREGRDPSHRPQQPMAGRGGRVPEDGFLG